MIIKASIETKADTLRAKHSIDFLPVDVNSIAEQEGIKLIAFDLGDDVSGLLHMNKDGISIGYNPFESKVRQRFTIAHELGHYVLHSKKGNVFIDNENYYKVMLRSTKADLSISSEDFKNEQEANSFAAALLMPQSLLLKELQFYSGFDLSDGNMITDLAKTFEVSTQAMSFRIINLSNSGLL